MKINKGEEYTTKSGRFVQWKCIKEGCNEKCRLKCKDTITLEERKKLFDDFYSITSVNRKRDLHLEVNT